MKKNVDLAVPTNEDDFRTLINDRCYFVDKTLLIKELLENRGTKITLITRPRRFGKTLNMTMLREFFDITVDSKDIFEGTKIMKEADCVKLMNKVPVVYLSFKSCDGRNKNILLDNLKYVIRVEYDRYYNEFKDKEKIQKTTVRFLDEIYEMLTRKKTDTNYEEIESYLPKSLFVLTQAIYEHYNIKPIVIIDEYDYPFIEAKVHVYYDEVNTTLSALFCETFKGNEYLDKGIMTGIQKIAQESIFSKFNNPSICSVADKKYNDKFGLTEEETRKYLEYFGYKLDDEVKNYYDGYKFNGKEIYNPMSITKYISEEGELSSYWVNTSANTLIRESILESDEDFREDFDELIENGTCETIVSMNTSFVDEFSESDLWGLLLNAGYITIDKVIEEDTFVVKIPNEEVKREFRKIVAKYIGIRENVLKRMFRALINKDVKTFIKQYQSIILKNSSFFDANAKENSYHMMMLGMCIYLEPRFEVRSNRETGYGRFDLTIKAKHEGDLNVIIEFKYLDSDTVEKIKNANKDKNKVEQMIKKELESKADEALSQIKGNKYDCEMKGEVLMLGIAHRTKRVVIKHELKKI